MFKKLIITFLLILGWITLVIRLYLRIVESDFSVFESTVQFFSYFTILTNLLVTMYCTVQLFDSKGLKKSIFHRAESLTALTVFIFLVGLVYHIALKPIWNPTGVQMVLSEIHHTVVPLGTLLLWMHSLKYSSIQFRPLLLWLIYPIVYISFVLGIGAVSGFYPYPFLHVGEIGMQQVLINSSALLGLMVVLLIAFYGVGKIRSNVSRT